MRVSLSLLIFTGSGFSCSGRPWPRQRVDYSLPLVVHVSIGGWGVGGSSETSFQGGPGSVCLPLNQGVIKSVDFHKIFHHTAGRTLACAGLSSFQLIMLALSLGGKSDPHSLDIRANISYRAFPSRGTCPLLTVEVIQFQSTHPLTNVCIFMITTVTSYPRVWAGCKERVFVYGEVQTTLE